MVHLNTHFAKYQIHFNILPTYSKNFIWIKHAWPQLQPPKQFEMDSTDLIPLLLHYDSGINGLLKVGIFQKILSTLISQIF